MSIGETITRKRKALGMTQKELAEKLSVSFQAVSKWETDASHPDVELLTALAEVLGTTVDALVKRHILYYVTSTTGENF